MRVKVVFRGCDEIGMENPDLVGTGTDSRERDKGIAGARSREKRAVEVAGQEGRLSRSPRDPWGNKSGGRKPASIFAAVKGEGLGTE